MQANSPLLDWQLGKEEDFQDYQPVFMLRPLVNHGKCTVTRRIHVRRFQRALSLPAKCKSSLHIPFPPQTTLAGLVRMLPFARGNALAA
jgi:hypothetical protein